MRTLIVTPGGGQIAELLVALHESGIGHLCDIARSRMEFRFECKSGRAADVTAMTKRDPRR
jgi:hypothetical protein